MQATRLRGTPRRFRKAGSGNTNSRMQSLLAAPPPNAHGLSGAVWLQNAGTDVALAVGDDVTVGDRVGVGVGVVVRVSVGVRLGVGERVGLKVGENAGVRVLVAVEV